MSGEKTAAEAEGIVVSSRVRLARNLEGYPFPGWSRKPERLKLIEIVRPAVEALPEMEGAISQAMDSITALDKQVLVEKHLISREHAGKNVGSAVVLSRNGTLSVMINEEDHLRMQAISPGFCLDEVHRLIDGVDTRLAEVLPFAFSAKMGYLTACPTNVGTGMRASAITNLMTRGEREPEILARLDKVISEIVRHEINARATLLEKSSRMLYDQIGRAYGVLAHARVISSKECMNLLSMIQLGVTLGAFDGLAAEEVERLLIETQPAHLQRGRGRSRLSAEERDALRADLIRSTVGRCKAPKLDITPPAGESPKSP